MSESSSQDVDAPTIVTDRLDLVVATTACLRAELDDCSKLGGALNAVLPDGWPPELYDRDAIEFTLARLLEAPADATWWMRYIIVRETQTIIGIAAFKGPPSANGSVEIGYALLPAFQKHGYATEAVNGLIETAFKHPQLLRVQAQTLPDLAASIRVLDRTGFVYAGHGIEDGINTVQYVLTRAAYENT